MSDAQAAPVSQNGAPAVEKTQPTTPGFKVFAGNLSYSTTDEGLKAFFAPVQSDILSVQVIHRGTRSAGYGFVALATEAAANKAVESLNKHDLDGRQVIVEIAKPADQKEKDPSSSSERKAKRRPGRRGYKAVPGEVTEAEANGEAPKPEGAAPAEGEQKPKKKRKANRKKKAATTTEGEAPKETPAAEGTEAAKKPRTRKPRAPRTPRPAGEDPAGEPSKNMLFVANLGFAVDDDALKALFTDAGITVTSARIVRRRWGQPRKSKGYGFVDVGSEENQNKAIAALDGKEVGGRAVAVKVAVNTPHEEDQAEGEAKPDAAATPAAPGPAAVAATAA